MSRNAERMKKLLIICGPTVTGKTSLGIKLAKGLSGEIVSADSRQVYRGMDIGTGKELPRNSKLKTQNSKLKVKAKNFQVGYYLFDKIPVWLLDVVEPDYRFSVADYVRWVSIVIKDIWRRKKLPIIVGGTGFYIKGLIDGIETLEVKPDWELRQQLSNLAIKQLRKKLRKLDPKRWEGMNESDQQNPRRLVRAIEIALKIKNEKLKMKNDNLKLKIDEVLLIGLKAPNEILYQRIDRRVNERVKQGIEKEIEGLLKKGYGWENSALGTTLGYREWQSFFEGKATKEEVIQRWKFNEHQYARRQMTWFKKALRPLGSARGKQAQGENKKVKRFDITRKNWKERVEKLVKEWYTEKKRT